jgi:hypothetical protein
MSPPVVLLGRCQLTGSLLSGCFINGRCISLRSPGFAPCAPAVALDTARVPFRTAVDRTNLPRVRVPRCEKGPGAGTWPGAPAMHRSRRAAQHRCPGRSGPSAPTTR